MIPLHSGNFLCAIILLPGWSPSGRDRWLYPAGVIGNVLIGGGHSLLWSIGLPLIEESSHDHRTLIYVGW